MPSSPWTTTEATPVCCCFQILMLLVACSPCLHCLIVIYLMDMLKRCTVPNTLDNRALQIIRYYSFNCSFAAYVPVNWIKDTVH